VETAAEFASLFVMVYSGIFSMALGGFAFYQCRLALMNVTSNENIREKWNATVDHQGQQIPSQSSRLKYFYFSDLPQSKVEAWTKISSEGNLLAKEPGEESLISNIEVLKSYGIYLN